MMTPYQRSEVFRNCGLRDPGAGVHRCVRRGTSARSALRGVQALVVVAAALGTARADTVESEDLASAERRLAPRSDSVFVSVSQIQRDSVSSRDVRLSAGVPVLRIRGVGVGVFLRYATTWIDSERRLPETLSLHRFDAQLGGGGRLAAGWSLRGALGVTYASDLNLPGLPGEGFQMTTALILRRVLGPSDAWVAGLSYSSGSNLFPVLPILGYVHQRAASPFRFEAMLPRHVRVVYQLTPRLHGALAVEAHGDKWLVRGMNRPLDARREGGSAFGEIGLAVYGPLRLDGRFGMSFDSYTLPDAMTGTSDDLPLAASAFAQLLLVVAQ